jgi:hypothetical protein
MAAPHSSADQEVDVERVLAATDAAAFLVAPRLLCRIIKRHRQIAGVGLQVPHRRCYVISRSELLQIISPQEVGIGQDAELPATLILIAHPNEGRSPPLPCHEALSRCWRLLFHGRVHAALEDRLAKGALTAAGIRRRIERIGQTEFEEIRRVLQQERHLLPPGDDCTAYVEFAALYLGLRCFAPHLIPTYFPGLGDCACIDALLAEDLDTAALLAGLGPECAPQIDTPARSSAPEEEDGPPDTDHASDVAAEPVQPCSDISSVRLGHEADQAAALGNTVRAAILRAQATPAEAAAEIENSLVRAQGELQVLARRLQPALALTDRETQEWGAALCALLGRAQRGFWTVEARLLYDLQKVCIDHERGIYEANVAGWLFSLGRRPLHRPVPAQQRVRVVRHLRSAARRLLRARLADADRRQLAVLFSTAERRNEERLRVEFRPIVEEALDAVGLVPANLPERVARHKLIEELLDRIVERGFLTLGDLRDSLAANQLKLPDLADVGDYLRGDRLLQLNRRLVDKLDGVYHGGEVYLRGLQRFSSVAFGTRLGRFLTRFVALPFGGAFVLLMAVSEIVEILTGRRAVYTLAIQLMAGIMLATASLPGPDFLAAGCALAELRAHRHLHYATLPAVLALGLFLFGLLHWPAFRRGVVTVLRWLGRGLRVVFLDAPAWVIRLPAVRAVLDSEPVLLFRRYALKPLVGAALGVGAGLLAGDTWMTSSFIGVSVFLGAILFFNTRFGREVEEAITDEMARSWRRLSSDIFPALFHVIMDFFKMILDRVERVLYAVDEWLRFKEGDNRLSRTYKPVLAMIWGFLTYILRFVLNVLVEPQINPVKHFPVVTVAHKMLLPAYPLLANVLQSALSLDRASSITLATAIIWCIPGLFGFLVWELKENWRLYAANRPENLRPVAIGHHGETMLRLLRPGFHSGTIPRLFGKLRRAERRGKRKAARKLRETMHEVAESIRHFVDREFLDVLRESRGWHHAQIGTRSIHLATNRIRVELCHPEEVDNSLWLEFAERSGWLVGRIMRPGWLCEVPSDQREVLELALAGFYKLAGVTVVAEQLYKEMGLVLAYSLTCQGLAVWSRDEDDAEAFYDLRNGAMTTARVTRGSFAAPLPVLDVRRVLFANVPITWEQWVEAWERDQAGELQGDAPTPRFSLCDQS